MSVNEATANANGAQAVTVDHINKQSTTTDTNGATAHVNNSAGDGINDNNTLLPAKSSITELLAPQQPDPVTQHTISSTAAPAATAPSTDTSTSNTMAQPETATTQSP